MANYNKVLLIGNLTRDPQLSYTPAQTPVVDFGLATNRKYTAQDGSLREDTCFVDCQAFGKQAETINKYMTKGNPIFIEGRLTFNSWTGQDGAKRSKHRVTVEAFQFLGRAQGAAVAEHTEPDVASHSPQTQENPITQEKTAGNSLPESEIPF